MSDIYDIIWKKESEIISMLILQVINDILMSLAVVLIVIVFNKIIRKFRMVILTKKYGKKIQRREEHFWDILRLHDDEEH